jgi:hypothetical protein
MAAAAFTLEPSGPPTGCDFPGCMAESFHEGDHVVAEAKPRSSPQPVHHCVVCGRGFIVYADLAHPIPRTCGSQECVLHLCRRETTPAPILCCCRQRSYAHELTVHTQIASESFNPKLRFRYPWSLVLSSRVEPSTERRKSE